MNKFEMNVRIGLALFFGGAGVIMLIGGFIDDCIAGVRITYQQLKGGKTWFDAGSLAQEL
jgi:hypothetical protein